MHNPYKVIDKVLIYATRNEQILVFQEPDYAHIPLQIPGGTINDGEEPAMAAYREFHEETGILRTSGIRFLECLEYVYFGTATAQVHRRHCFHLPLEGDFPAQWQHYEMFPADEAKPILFNLFWLPFEQAQVQLGLEMEKSITKIGL